ncbi:baseplate J/gp47 family protein [Candidatus Gottesmanbacteria bacterium]|nr:baseplate J/gp47 family protein [Candidatus Gottesmanbacteria bacterium]
MHPTGEQFLAVKISSSLVLATTWSTETGKVTTGLIGRGEISESGFDPLLKATDAAVSQALGIKSSAKTIFGLTSDWIIDGKITEEKLGILKKLCQELDLRPLGYVLLSEALENYFKNTEGAPLTGILIGIDRKQGWVSVYRAGKNLGTVPLPEGENIPDQIEQALKRFHQVDVLPARMIIYDGQEDLTVLEEKIMAHPWTKQLPFLHFPKVEVVPAEAVVKAVATVGEEKKPVISSLPAMPKISLPELPKFSPPKFSLPKFHFNLAIPVLAFLLLIAGLMAAVYFVPKVKVIVHLSAKSFDKEMDITAPGQGLEVSEIGTKKGVVTGKKLVGDKAKGTVTIFNTADAKVFSAGTTITNNGLKFILDIDANVATGSPAQSSQTSVAVTAAEIGDKYNLPAGTLFSISSYQEAKNENAFSGGNSHQATVVAKEDQTRLMATLSAELTAKAQNDLQTKLSSGQSLLPNAITFQVAKKKFSKEVDQEADTVSLDLTLDFKGVVISRDEAVTKFKEKFSGEIPAGYDLLPDQANLEIKTTKQDKTGSLILTSRLTAKLLPQMDKEQITKSISGKSVKEATKIIMSVTGVNAVDFEVAPKFFRPVINLFLPWRSGAITNVYLFES